MEAATFVDIKNIPVGAPTRPAEQPTTYCGSDPVAQSAVDLVRSALLVQQTFNIAKSQSTSAPLTQETMAAMTKAIADVVAELYESAPGSVVTYQYDAALSASAEPSVRAVDGGVATFACRALSAGTSTFSLTADSRIWATMGSVRSNGAIDFAQPANDMIVTATVRKSTSGRLKIASMAIDFAAGSRP